MQLKFDPNQGYQLTAINSVVNLFDGLPEAKAAFVLGDEIVPNIPPDQALYDSWLLDNLSAVRAANGLEDPIMNLAKDDGFELDGVSDNSWEFPSFTVEMETGTGKT